MATMAPTSSRRAARMVTAMRPVIPLSSPCRSAGRPQAERLLGVADPAPDRITARQIETALVRHARIGQQRDIGQGQGFTDEKARTRELTLQMIERRITAQIG